MRAETAKGVIREPLVDQITATSSERDRGGDAGLSVSRTSRTEPLDRWPNPVNATASRRRGATPPDRASHHRMKDSLHRDKCLGPLGLTAVSNALGEAALAMILLDGLGHLRFANQLARDLLSEGDALVLDGGNVIRCRDRGAQLKFDRMIRSAANAASKGAPSPNNALAIPRRFGRPLAARVTCKSTTTDEPSNSNRLSSERVVVFLRDAERLPEDNHGDIETVFSLSSAEAQVVGRLSTGLSPQDIATERSVSLTTVRNQIKSAQAKVGVNRQAELVSVVLRTLHF